MSDEIDDMPCDPEEAAAMEYIDAQMEIHEHEHQDRLWLRTCVVFMESACKPNRSEVGERVQFAMNKAVIAACERAVRIFNSDLPPIDDVDGKA